MIEAIYVYGNEKADEISLIRNDCFNELEIVMDATDVAQDKHSFHAIVYEDTVPVAVGRLVVSDLLFYLDHIYVIKDKRYNSYGDLVVKMLLDKAFILGADIVLIKSEPEVIRFFKKIGFIEVKKEEYSGTYNMMISQEMIKKCRH